MQKPEEDFEYLSLLHSTFFFSLKQSLSLDLVVHTFNFNTWEGAEDLCEFKASQGYIVKLLSQKKE